MSYQPAKGPSMPLYNSRTADKFVVRLPDGMREQVSDTAAEAHRSMNAEIIYRLTHSMEQDEEIVRLKHVIDGLLQENKRLKQMCYVEFLSA